MGNAVAFDTHKFVKQLMAAGFNEEQAETQMGLLSEILSAQLSTKSDVANVDAHVLELKRDIAAIDAKVENTKAELKRDIAAIDAKVENTKAELKRDIKELDVKIETINSDLKRDIKESELKLEGKIESVKKDIEVAKSDTLKWTAGMFAAQTALIIGAMFAVMKMNQPITPAYQPPAQEMRQIAPVPPPVAAQPPTQTPAK